MSEQRTGHGDHWLAALEPDDPRLIGALELPKEVPAGVALLREPLSAALDRVQVIVGGRLVTAYPEPRATTLFAGRPRALELWDTRVEGWLTLEDERVGALTVFVTDLAENARSYARGDASRMEIEIGALAYLMQPAFASDRPTRLEPAAARDARFLPDDYAFDAIVESSDEVADETVVHLRLHGGLVLPTTARHVETLAPGQRVQGYLWLTGRCPQPE